MPSPCPSPGALTSAVGPLPAAPPPPPCGSTRSRRRAHLLLHSPVARLEGAPGPGRGGWWGPRWHRPQPGQGQPSQSAPGSAAGWPRGPAPAHLPPVPFPSGSPSPRWLKEPVARMGTPVLAHRAGPWEAASREPPALRGRWLVDRGPAGPLAAPRGDFGPSAAHSAAASQGQDWAGRLSGALSICSSVCPDVCCSPSSQQGAGGRGGFPKKVCSALLGRRAPVASGRQDQDLRLKGRRRAGEAGSVPTAVPQGKFGASESWLWLWLWLESLLPRLPAPSDSSGCSSRPLGCGY